MNRIQLPYKQLFIKVENIVTPHKSYQVFNFIKNDDPITVQDLIKSIKEHYGFIDSEVNKIRLELWSGPIGSKRIRLDCCKHIPDKYDTIWVRGYVNQDNINQENPKEENNE